jgi:hypothetical protein
VNQRTCHHIKNSCCLGSWILDFGASHHIYNSTQWFHSYNEITLVSVKLPNGNSVIAKYAGTVKFSSHFTLYNVLYVPNFSVNLISVLKLSHLSQYLINVSQCVIQDPTNHQKMIGFVEAYEGHLSTNRLSILHSKFPYIFVDHKGICDMYAILLNT